MKRNPFEFDSVTEQTFQFKILLKERMKIEEETGALKIQIHLDLCVSVLRVLVLVLYTWASPKFKQRVSLV